MITLIASLAGFFTSALPELFKIWHDRADKQHELTLLGLQMEMQKATLGARLGEVGMQADAAETTALYRTYYSGIQWVDGLNGMIRPLLTMAFFILYAAVKFIQWRLLGDHAPLFLTLDTLWNEEDQAIFAGIISFYFGQRAMNKKRG
jgi:hypothetical protein